jgi:hypothetical protein
MQDFGPNHPLQQTSAAASVSGSLQVGEAAATAELARSATGGLKGTTFS